MKSIPSDANLKLLDIYDESVRAFVDGEIRRYGYNPTELEPVINLAISESKKLVHDEEIALPPQIIICRIGEPAYNYIKGVLSQNEKFKGAFERIKAYHSIFLVGAGLSYESDLPLTAILSDLLTFCDAKDYEDLRSDAEKSLRFKTAFKENVENKNPGNSHRLIVMNFPMYIREIVCLNWDNLIEKVADEQKKFILKINEDEEVKSLGCLWKFHGDVDNIKKKCKKGQGEWVFPDEEGYVFDNFLNYIKKNKLDNQLFTFVIVGYSEKEKVIYEKIIKCFEEQKKRPTIRVGLDLARLSHDNYIVGPSAYVLNKILPVNIKLKG